MTHGLTARQVEALDFIQSYMAMHRVSPTFREIGQGIGEKSSGRVHRLVHALIDRGAVTILPRRSRSIALVERAA